MWTALAFVLALDAVSPAADALAVTDVRATYGAFGATRPDKKVLAGESFCLTFNIRNLKADAGGELQYSLAIELLNPRGKAEWKLNAPPSKGRTLLGGNALPAFAQAATETTAAPGKYTAKVTVTDERTQRTAVLTQGFEVLPADFGIADLAVSRDAKGSLPASPRGVVGETLYLQFAVLGFKLNDRNNPAVDLTLRVLDEAGRPVAAPVEGPLTQAPPPGSKAEAFLAVPLNRAGKFIMELTAVDTLAGNERRTKKLPLVVTNAD